ncbi:hypothetical protein N8542_00400, partial [Verrucomicrobia bacterium]|nr:hypothetical protein [Verrucomicrobiota bacterium]
MKLCESCFLIRDTHSVGKQIKIFKKKTGLRETHTVNKFPETRQILSYDKENLWHWRDSLANFK